MKLIAIILGLSLIVACSSNDKKRPNKVAKNKPVLVKKAVVNKPLIRNKAVVGKKNLARNPFKFRKAPILAKRFTSFRTLKRVVPVYPKLAKAEKVAGWVHLRFDVDKNGNVVNPKVLDASPKDYGFEEAALVSIKASKFDAKATTGVEKIVEFSLD